LIVLLHREINKLPPQCQKIFKLNRFERLKYKEIALMLGVSEKTVENHIGTALRMLRKALLDKNQVSKTSKKYDFIVSLYLY